MIYLNDPKITHSTNAIRLKFGATLSSIHKTAPHKNKTAISDTNLCTRHTVSGRKNCASIHENKAPPSSPIIGRRLTSDKTSDIPRKKYAPSPKMNHATIAERSPRIAPPEWTSPSLTYPTREKSNVSTAPPARNPNDTHGTLHSFAIIKCPNSCRNIAKRSVKSSLNSALSRDK